MPPRKAKETALTVFIADKKKEAKAAKAKEEPKDSAKPDAKPDKAKLAAENEELEQRLTEEFEALDDALKQKYATKASQVNEQRARARALRIKRKKETSDHRAQEAVSTHFIEHGGEGTMDPSEYKRLAAQHKDGAKPAKVAALSMNDRLEIPAPDGSQCVVHEDMVLRIVPNYGQSLL
eukprot:TRINITY_DN6494_c0_g1_i1.p1 TRINITY_DN6494_c0_g1~~TRINITY_DN6494_c0_g1_i1.p1  ORF type:complete len:179 (+),score=53.20 TRINITY_DN6494_c0_g1_i1:49-585(+)